MIYSMYLFLFWQDEGADLPLPPPMKENRFIVPNGIRPVLVRTGVEVNIAFLVTFTCALNSSQPTL